MPVVFSLGFITVDYALGDDFEVEESHVQLLEVIIGGTVIGGTANAGFKRYTKVKQTLADAIKHG